MTAHWTQQELRTAWREQKRAHRGMTKHTAPTGTIKSEFLGILGPREFAGTATNGTLDLCGDIVVASGGDVTDFMRAPVLLDSHDSSTATNVIGTVTSMELVGDRWDFVAEFLPQGMSSLADELCARVKSGAVRSVSIGFLPIEYEFIDKTFGIRFTKWSLLELSLCAVGANPDAKITQRSFGGGEDIAAYRRDEETVQRLKSRLSGPLRQQAFEDDESQRDARVAELKSTIAAIRREEAIEQQQRAAAAYRSMFLTW